MNSFASAMQRLGGSVVYMRSSDSSVQKGETLEGACFKRHAHSYPVVYRNDFLKIQFR